MGKKMYLCIFLYILDYQRGKFRREASLTCTKANSERARGRLKEQKERKDDDKHHPFFYY